MVYSLVVLFSRQSNITDCAITSTIFRTLQTAERRQLTIYSWEICDNFNVKKTINGTTFESHFWQK